MRKSITTMFLAAVIASVPAFGGVTFDPATGTGFVGKGDVQMALGYNNPVMQAEAGNLAFTYVAETMLSQLCQKETGGAGQSEIKIHYHTWTWARSLNAGVTYQSRTNQQVSGFNLTGYSDFSSGGGLPSNICRPDESSNWVPAAPVQVISSSPGVLTVANTVNLAGPVVIWTEPAP